MVNSTHRDMGDDERQSPQREAPSPPPDEPALHGHCMPCLAGAATARLATCDESNRCAVGGAWNKLNRSVRP